MRTNNEIKQRLPWAEIYSCDQPEEIDNCVRSGSGNSGIARLPDNPARQPDYARADIGTDRDTRGIGASFDAAGDGHGRRQFRDYKPNSHPWQGP